MIRCDIGSCDRIFTSKKSYTNHRRWHSLPEYDEFKDSFILKSKKRMEGNDYGKANNNSNNGMWKGNKAGYSALHAWVKSRLPKTDNCECCNDSKPYDLANVSQQYRRNLSDWEWLCRRCHMLKDGRIYNLKQNKEMIPLLGV